MWTLSSKGFTLRSSGWAVLLFSYWAGSFPQKRLFQFLTLALSGLEGRQLLFPNSLSNVLDLSLIA